MPLPADIIRSHAPSVWATLCRLLGTRHAADLDDSFQETFAAALDLAQRQPVTHWDALLRRIATRKAMDILRSRYRDRSRMQDAEISNDLPASWEKAGDPLEQAELAASLRRALVRLGPDEAELFCLRHLEDLSYEQIAQHMQMTPGAVGVALHRTREKLRGWLTPRHNRSQNEVRHD